MHRSYLSATFILTGVLLLGVDHGLAQPPPTVSTSLPASILIFPNVVADDARDTVIEIVNTHNTITPLRCFQRNFALPFPDQPEGPGNQPLLTQTDFSLSLMAQQPTHWVVSRGRPLDMSDPPCSPDNSDCDGAGVDPGEIPPVPNGFRGFLLCVTVGIDGTPLASNSVIGSATVVELANGDVADYPAFGIGGTDFAGETGAKLCIGAGNGCPHQQYAACPLTWVVNQTADGAPDRLAGEGSIVHSSLTVMTCSEDFESQQLTPVVVQILAIDESGGRFSSSFNAGPWETVSLTRYGLGFDSIRSNSLQLQIRSVNGHGMVIVPEERRETGGEQPLSAISISPAMRTDVPGADVIFLPDTGGSGQASARGVR